MASIVPGNERESAPAGEGYQRIVWAERDMPVLRAIRGRFEAEKPLAGLRVSACLNITAETANLARTLVAGGADLVLVAPERLATQGDVVASLASDFGIVVQTTEEGDDADDHRPIAEALKHRPHLTLDDGADLVGALCSIASGRLDEVHGEVRAWAESLEADEQVTLVGEVVASIEETATGVARLRVLEKAGTLRLPVIAAHAAQTKHFFDNRYGTGQSTIDGILRATDMLIAGKRVVICGYGWCGRGIARRAQGLGGHVVVTEIDPIRALEAVMDGFEVMEVAQAARVGDLFITVTGNLSVIRGEHFAAMKDGATVCNAGHFPIELALDQLGAIATPNKGVRPFVDEYVLQDGRRISILGEGRLINLAAAHGHPASVMDISFGVQALTVEWALQMKGRLGPKVYNVPREVDRWVAHLKLQSMGIVIDTLTPDQTKYLESQGLGVGP